MRDRPSAAELLAAARRALLHELVPALPEDRVEATERVATAIAIAEREAAAGEAPLLAERDALAALYGEAPDPVEPLAEALIRLNARFARDLRAGAFDASGSRRQAALRVLCASARMRLAENNPGYPTD